VLNVFSHSALLHAINIRSGGGGSRTFIVDDVKLAKTRLPVQCSVAFALDLSRGQLFGANLRWHVTGAEQTAFGEFGLTTNNRKSARGLMPENIVMVIARYNSFDAEGARELHKNHFVPHEMQISSEQRAKRWQINGY
jgi:hypothetical protein